MIFELLGESGEVPSERRPVGSSGLGLKLRFPESIF